MTRRYLATIFVHAVGVFIFCWAGAALGALL